jgi:NACalpha-BTF3-like transcription factor
MVLVNKVTTIFDKMFDVDKKKHNVVDLLTPELNYIRKTITIYNHDIGNFEPEKIESRNINEPHNIYNQRKPQMYETIVNCSQKQNSRVEDNDDKYRRLLLSRNEPSDSNPEDETIDDMLKRIVKQNKMLNIQINNINSNSKIHWASFYNKSDVKKISLEKIEGLIGKIVNTDLLFEVNRLLNDLKEMDDNQRDIYKDWEKMQQVIDGTGTTNTNNSSSSEKLAPRIAKNAPRRAKTAPRRANPTPRATLTNPKATLINVAPKATLIKVASKASSSSLAASSSNSNSTPIIHSNSKEMVPDIFSSALSFKSKTDDGDEEVDEEGENGDEEDIDSDPKDEYVPTEADINVIIQLVRVTREKAFQALVDTDGDLLAAAQKIHNNT